MHLLIANTALVMYVYQHAQMKIHSQDLITLAPSYIAIVCT